MSPLAELGAKPVTVSDEIDFATWFVRLADRLLNGIDLLVAGTPYRFAELEAYYHGPGHADPFAHRDRVQLENGRWYFHRTGSAYRGGSFKGLDLALGDGTAYFGMLIRSIVDPSGTVIAGPSLTVDHLLTRTGVKDVATLDRVIGTRKVWDESAPLAIRESQPLRAAKVYSCSRVGLSLNQAPGHPDAPRFVGRPYRYLTEPRAIVKGRIHLVLALHQCHNTPDAIHTTTGVPRKTIERYVADFEAGRVVPKFDQYFGKELNTATLCRMLGTWAAQYGNPAAANV